MTKRLFLHLGANKTGSTAIQEFLRLNQQRLQDLRVHVAPPDLLQTSEISGQQGPYIEALIADPATGAEELRSRIDALMSDLPDGGMLVLSAENLSNPGNGSPRLFTGFSERYEVTALLYIRRPDEFLLSSWRQWYSKVSDDFWAWTIAAAGRRCDWRVIIQGWEHVVARERLRVRVYDRSRLHKRDVVADFAQCLGLPEDISSFELPKGNINPSYSEAVQDFVKGNPLLFRDMHDDETYRIIDELTGDRFHRKSGESEITFAQRTALLQKYDEANEWVRLNYFPGTEGPLFRRPEQKEFFMTDPEQLDREKWDLAASLIYGLAKQVMPSKPPQIRKGDPGNS